MYARAGISLYLSANAESWQISGRSEITDFEQVVALDRSYIANWSLGLDVKILCKTVGVVLRHEGAM